LFPLGSMARRWQEYLREKSIFTEGRSLFRREAFGTQDFTAAQNATVLVWALPEKRSL
jgi:hypothetical protein